MWTLLCGFTYDVEKLTKINKKVDSKAEGILMHAYDIRRYITITRYQLPVIFSQVTAPLNLATALSFSCWSCLVSCEALLASASAESSFFCRFSTCCDISAFSFWTPDKWQGYTNDINNTYDRKARHNNDTKAGTVNQATGIAACASNVEKLWNEAQNYKINT